MYVITYIFYVLVSFLLPTRHRVKRLIHSLESLENTVNDKQSYEIILKIDDDDDETKKFCETTKWPTIISPRGKGYLDLHTFVNACAANSKGEYLFLWNDDAIMQTIGWDVVLNDHLKDDPFVYFPNAGGSTRNWFPIVRRRIYQILGRFSESALNDFYMSTVARLANIERNIKINILHDHPAVGGIIRDQIYWEAIAANVICKHDGRDPRIIECINEDVAKIKGTLK